MGFFDRFKPGTAATKQGTDAIKQARGALKEAQQLQKQMEEVMGKHLPAIEELTPGGPEYHRWVMEIHQTGLQGEGTITAIRKTGRVDREHPEFEIDVDATVDGEEIAATATMYLATGGLAAYQPGQRVLLMADQEDKSTVFIKTGINE